MIISNQLFSIELHSSTGEIEGLRLCSNPFVNLARRGKLGMPSALQYLDKKEVGEKDAKLVYQFLSNDVKCFAEKRLTDRGLEESYEFLNDGKKEVELTSEDLGIYLTFSDGVDIPKVMPRRSFTQVEICGSSSFVKSNLFTGGGVAMVLTEGSLSSYSVERGRSLNERGDLIVEPFAKTLKIGESYKISWIIFPFENDLDFLSKAKEYSPLFLEIGGEIAKPSGEDFVFETFGEKAVVDGVEYPVKEGVLRIPSKVDCEKEVEIFYGENKACVLCRSYNLPTLVVERSKSEPSSLQDKICHCLLLLVGGKKGYISPSLGEKLVLELKEVWESQLSYEGRLNPFVCTALSNLFLLWGEMDGGEEYTNLGEDIFERLKESKEGKYLYFNPLCGVENISPRMAEMLEDQENLDFSEMVFSFDRQRDMAIVKLALGKEIQDIQSLLVSLPVASRDYRKLSPITYWHNFKEGDTLCSVGWVSFADMLYRLERKGLVEEGCAKRFAKSVFAFFSDGEGYSSFSFPRKVNDLDAEGGNQFSFAPDYLLGYVILKELV